MANTIMSAKNGWNEGLIMDLSPDNTSANCLTAALNATLITYNGNEMALLNDMGNARVETAFLPEGYIPVGTCEFGDIIYIVSYNPLINKSLIGCFPSPERNISSEEKGNMDISLKCGDFLKVKDGNPTGELIATSVKKILYNKNMNPGDKYIIYADNGLNEGNLNRITDYGNADHLYGTFPKLTKIHVVALEDSGKINFLDSTVKWYDNDYFILATNQDRDTMTPDIDSYRSLVSSAYSVFLSKVTGKLALLIELERIDTFDCAYTIYTEENPINNGLSTKTYKIYFNVSWETSNKDINPSEIVITDANWPNILTKEDKDGNSKTGIWYCASEECNPLEVYENPENYSWIRGTEHYGAILSRTYAPESFKGDYTTFLKTYHYDNVIAKKTAILEDNSEEIPKDHWGYTGDQNSWPQTLLLKVKNGVPVIDDNEGEYYINAQYVYEDGYGYTRADGTPYNCTYAHITDDLVNNFFNKSVAKHVLDIELPHKTVKDGVTNYVDLSNFVWNYSIAPAMPYGVLEDLTVKGTIDFSKVGTGYTELSEWRYYNDGNVSTLKWGLETYPEQGKKITLVRFDFYDNRGLAASYIVPDKESYSGSFTEIIQLGTEGNNPNLSIINKEGEIIKHMGEGPFEIDANASDKEQFIELVKENIYVVATKEEKPKIVDPKEVTLETCDNYNYYVNDAGYIYPNLLYLVHIFVDYRSYDSLGNPIGDKTTSDFVRWYWTNTLMNRYYYEASDFVSIQPQIDFNLDSIFQSNEKFELPNPQSNPSRYIKNNLGNTAELTLDSKIDEIIKASMGCIIQEVKNTSGLDSNVDLKLYPILDDSYGSFAFDKGYLLNIKYHIGFSKEKIDISEHEIEYTDAPVVTTLIKGTSTDERDKISDEEYPQTYTEEGWKDWFSLTPLKLDLNGDRITYYNTLGEELITDSNEGYVNTDALTASKGIPFSLEGVMFSKIAGSVIKIDYPIDAIIYRPVVQESKDFNNYNIYVDETNKLLYFESLVTLGMNGNGTGEKEKPHALINTASSIREDKGVISLVDTDTSHDGVNHINYTENLKFGTICKDKNIDVGLFSMVTFWCYGWGLDERKGDSDEHTDGYIELRTNANRNYSALSWKDSWHCLPSGTGFIRDTGESNNRNNCIRFPMKGENLLGAKDLYWGNNIDTYSAHTLAAFIAKNIDGNYIIYNNFCSFLPRNSLPVTQLFAYNEKWENTKQKEEQSIGGCSTFALMLASLLAKLYIKSSQTERKEINIISNILTCTDYTDTWKKDIVVQVGISEGYNTKLLLSIVGINYDTYYKDLILYLGDVPDIIDNNANIKLNLGKIHTIEFQYSLTYDIEYLEKLYNLVEARYYIESDITRTYSKGILNEPPFTGQFAIRMSDTEFFTNANGSTIQIPSICIKEDFKYSNNEEEVSFPAKILSQLEVKDDIIMLKSGVNLSAHNSYRIYMIDGESKTTRNLCYLRFSADDVFFNDSATKLVK